MGAKHFLKSSFINKTNWTGKLIHMFCMKKDEYGGKNECMNE